MRLFRTAGLRAADRAAAEAGVDTYDLMLAAGAAVAAALRRRWPDARRVAVLAGPGNNGGDGYVAALRLLEAGLTVTLHELSDAPGAEDAARARRELLAHGRDGLSIAPSSAPPGDADVVVDALFGSGLRRPLEGTAARWVEATTASGRPVLAVDVPSGVRADRAGLQGVVVRAHATVQLAGATIASALAPARGAFGDWEVADIGIPERILVAEAAGRLLDAADVAPTLAPPADDVHKYRAGTVLVLGGSRRYAGAAELAARGAYRAGAGLVTVAAAARPPSGWPEVIWEALDDAGDPSALVRSLDPRRRHASVLGPGWDVAADDLRAALAACAGPVVLDAGALAHDLATDARERGGVTLTPHHGEAARLLQGAGIEIDVADDPVAAAEALAEVWGAIAVLKGAGSVVADAEGRLALSRAGDPAMATAGTGDVLAGVIGARLARGVAAAQGRHAGAADARFEQVAAATLLHGTAGEIAATRGAGMVASDLVEALPEALGRLGAAC